MASAGQTVGSGGVREGKYICVNILKYVKLLSVLTI